MFDFPNSPTTGQQFTPTGGPTYTWNGYAWALAGSPSAGMLNQQVFTASGTYTPTPGMQTAIIECVGGGGGGNGVAATTGNITAAGGGGSGGYSRKLVTAAQVGASQVVIVGAGGTGAVAGQNAGGAGGDTSVGSLCIAKGARASTAWNLAGLGGLPGTGDIAAAGTPGSSGSFIAATTQFALIGNGASSIFGGGTTTPASTGVNASNYGAGGSGALGNNNASALAGGNGSPGIVIITEYASVPVGTAGPSAQGYTPGAYINKFRNPGMDVAQRGTPGTVTINTTAYTLDGWLIGTVGAGMGWSQQYNANLSANALRMQCSSGMTGCVLLHRIESSIAAQLLKNNKTAQPITVQFTIYNNSGAAVTPTISADFPTARDNFGTTTADLAPVNLQSIANGAMAVLAYTFTPSVSCQLGYLIRLAFGNQLNAASGYVDISYADIRATPGIVTGLNNNPPPVELRPIQQELAYCQRYYWTVASHLLYAYSPVSGGVGQSSVLFPVAMRAAPTMVFTSTSYTNCSALGGGVNTVLWNPSLTVTAAGNYQVLSTFTLSAEL